jgi:hypothetical protein
MNEKLTKVIEGLEATETRLEYSILTAIKVTRADREKTYSHPLLNFITIAAKWSLRGILQGKISPQQIYTPVDVAWMELDLKDARLMATAHKDGITDSIGYVDCADRIAQYLLELGFVTTWEQGYSYFEGWNILELVEFLPLVKEAEKKYIVSLQEKKVD